MSNLMASIEAVSSPDPLRRKPRLIIRGLRRRFVQHLLKKLEVVQRMDVRERTQSELKEYTPVLFSRTTTLDNQVKALVQRCKELLEARA